MLVFYYLKGMFLEIENKDLYKVLLCVLRLKNKIFFVIFVEISFFIFIDIV